MSVIALQPPVHEAVIRNNPEQPTLNAKEEVLKRAPHSWCMEMGGCWYITATFQGLRAASTKSEEDAWAKALAILQAKD